MLFGLVLAIHAARLVAQDHAGDVAVPQADERPTDSPPADAPAATPVPQASETQEPAAPQSGTTPEAQPSATPETQASATPEAQASTTPSAQSTETPQKTAEEQKEEKEESEKVEKLRESNDVGSLVAALGDESFKVREAASLRLRQLGVEAGKGDDREKAWKKYEQMQDALKKGLKSPDLETRRRSERALNAMPPFMSFGSPELDKVAEGLVDRNRVWGDIRAAQKTVESLKANQQFMERLENLRVLFTTDRRAALEEAKKLEADTKKLTGGWVSIWDSDGGLRVNLDRVSLNYKGKDDFGKSFGIEIRSARDAQFPPALQQYTQRLGAPFADPTGNTRPEFRGSATVTIGKDGPVVSAGLVDLARDVSARQVDREDVDGKVQSGDYRFSLYYIDGRTGQPQIEYSRTPVFRRR